MPKIKTKRGAAKRFRFTSSGKIKRNKAYASHLLSSKTRKRKRGLRKSGQIDAHDVGQIKRLLPNG